jgi:hypothetical protein
MTEPSARLHHGKAALGGNQHGLDPIARTDDLKYGRNMRLDRAL